MQGQGQIGGILGDFYIFNMGGGIRDEIDFGFQPMFEIPERFFFLYNFVNYRWIQGQANLP